MQFKIRKMLLILIIKSKHQRSFLTHFLILYFIVNKLSIAKKLINKNIRIIKFVLLKSPHINKSSQQHFGFNIYRKEVLIFSVDLIRFSLLTKLYLLKLSNLIYINIIYCLSNKLYIIKKQFLSFNLELLSFIFFILQKITYVIEILNFTCFKILKKANNSKEEYSSDKRKVNSSILF